MIVIDKFMLYPVALCSSEQTLIGKNNHDLKQAYNIHVYS